MAQDQTRMDGTVVLADSLTPHYPSVEAAERRLRQSPYIELRRISCSVREGVLTLFGSVPSYYLKQMAQNVVGRLPGVREIENCLEVVSPLALLGPARGDSRPASQPRPRPR